MPRYFIEVAYKGTRYCGFQIQQNANTIQSEVEKAFAILHRSSVALTGSSRTDAGVHALQNYFHFDYEDEINKQFIYKMNAILPTDIVVVEIHQMPADAHCRFDAIGREYEYRIYNYKNPFLQEFAYYYPYKLDMELMQQAASIISTQTNFYAFSKTNTQVKNYNCHIYISQWINKDGILIYNIAGNRFLRGMVRLLTATMLQLGRGKLSLQQFNLFFGNLLLKTSFSVPAQGLFLKEVQYQQDYFPQL